MNIIVWFLHIETFLYLKICLYVLIYNSTILVTRLYTLASSGLPNLYSLEAVQWSYCFHLITSVLAIREKYSLYKYVNICLDIINNTIIYHTTSWGIYLKIWKIQIVDERLQLCKFLVLDLDSLIFDLGSITDQYISPRLCTNSHGCSSTKNTVLSLFSELFQSKVQLNHIDLVTSVNQLFDHNRNRRIALTTWIKIIEFHSDRIKVAFVLHSGSSQTIVMQ